MSGVGVVDCGNALRAEDEGCGESGERDDGRGDAQFAATDDRVKCRAGDEGRESREQPAAANRGNLRNLGPLDQRMRCEKPGVSAANQIATQVLDADDGDRQHDGERPAWTSGGATEAAHEQREHDGPAREIHGQQRHAEFSDVAHPPFVGEKDHEEGNCGYDDKFAFARSDAGGGAEQRGPDEHQRPTGDKLFGERERQRKGECRKRCQQRRDQPAAHMAAHMAAHAPCFSVLHSRSRGRSPSGDPCGARCDRRNRIQGETRMSGILREVPDGLSA